MASVTIMAVLLSGCGPTARQLSTATQESAVEETEAPADEPVTEPEVATTISYSISMEDPSGYTGTLDLSIDPVDFTSDVADAPPGKTNIDADFAVSGTFLNTTEDRNMDMRTSYLQLDVWPAYDLSSPVCADPGELHSSTHCFLEGVIVAGGVDLPVGSYYDLQPGTAEAGTLAGYQVDEADAPALIAALNAPVGYAVRLHSTFGMTIPDPCYINLSGYGTGAGLQVTMIGIPDDFTCDAKVEIP